MRRRSSSDLSSPKKREPGFPGSQIPTIHSWNGSALWQLELLLRDFQIVGHVVWVSGVPAVTLLQRIDVELQSVSDLDGPALDVPSPPPEEADGAHPKRFRPQNRTGSYFPHLDLDDLAPPGRTHIEDISHSFLVFIRTIL